MVSTGVVETEGLPADVVIRIVRWQTSGRLKLCYGRTTSPGARASVTVAFGVDAAGKPRDVHLVQSSAPSMASAIDCILHAFEHVPAFPSPSGGAATVRYEVRFSVVR